MKVSKITQLIMDYGMRFLIGDSLSWGLMIGPQERDYQDTGDNVLSKKDKISYETHTRAWIKSIVWRLLGLVILGAISWVITHSWREMSLITILFHSIRVILYYFHERVWDKIHWGRIKHPLSVLPVNRALTPEDLNIVRNQLKKLGYLE